MNKDDTKLLLFMVALKNFDRDKFIENTTKALRLLEKEDENE